MTKQRMICCPGELLDRPDDAIDRAYFRGFLLNNAIEWGEALLVLGGGVTIPVRDVPGRGWITTQHMPEVHPPIARYWPENAEQLPRL
jgi:hypothetical protein